MSQPFAFPPPPPPPPKRDQSPAIQSSNAYRGRGNGRGQPTRGPSQASRGRGSYNSVNSGRGRGNFNTRSHVGKRDFGTAFSSHTQPPHQAHPTVPSFNVDVKSLLPAKAPIIHPQATRRKSNALGLTPTDETLSEPEDDADEETKLTTGATSGMIQFEHRGQKLSLNNPEEIAAWIAERRKRFPTQAKAEAAKKEAVEKQKRWAERKEAQAAVAKLRREERERERNEHERKKLKEKLLAASVAKAKSALAITKEDVAQKARAKAEKLRKQAERATRDLESAEEQLRLLEQGEGPDRAEMAAGEVSDSLTTSSINSEVEDTSSSGSSDQSMDSDDAPEEVASKRPGPERVAPPKRDRERTNNDSPQMCKAFLKTGRCKFGKRCRFSHKRQTDKPNKSLDGSTGRKGLYQILVEKEREEELRRALRAIISLGDQGVLDEPSSADVK